MRWRTFAAARNVDITRIRRAAFDVRRNRGDVSLRIYVRLVAHKNYSRACGGARGIAGEHACTR